MRQSVPPSLNSTMFNTIIMIILFSLLFSLCASFPLSDLFDHESYRYEGEEIHTYSGSDVALTTQIMEPTGILDLHPDVSLPTDLWEIYTTLIMRVNRNDQDVVWARALSGFVYTRSCVDSKQNLYFIGKRENSGDDSRGPTVSLQKYSPNGTMIWERIVNEEVSMNTYIQSNVFECGFGSTLFLSAENEGIPHLAVADSDTGNFTSIVSLGSRKAALSREFGSSTVDGVTCIFSLTKGIKVNGTKSENLFVHCIRPKGKLTVRSRKIAKILLPKYIITRPQMTLEPKREGTACQALYVMYPSTAGTLDKNERKPNQITFRKLCVDTLKDTPWLSGGRPYIRYITVQNGQNAIVPQYLSYVPKADGISVVVSVSSLLFETKSSSEENAKRPWTISNANVDLGSWLFFIGRKSRPKVVQLPVGEAETQEPRFLNSYNSFFATSYASSQNGKKVIVCGKLASTYMMIGFSRGPLYTLDIRVPLYKMK